MRYLKLVSVLAALGGLLAFAAPAAGASTRSPVRSSSAAVRCAAFPGNYCGRVFFTSVSGGIRVTETKSTGYTEGRGKAREYFLYSCASGTCFISPSRTFFYSHKNVQLNVTRFFSGSGKFLPCGNRFGMRYHNPDINGPDGAVLSRVRCGASGNGVRAG